MITCRSKKLKHKSLTIHPISDIHIEDPLSNKKALNAKLDSLRNSDESHRILLLGDLMDAAICGSKGFWHGAKSPDDALDLLLSTFGDLAERIDFILPGNHERRISKAAGIDILKRFAQILGIEASYSPELGILTYVYGNNKLTRCFLHHGYGGGKRTGSAVNNIEDLSKISPDCHLYLMGHNHRYGATKDRCFIDGKPFERTYVLTNTYLSYVQYAKDMGLPPGLDEGGPHIKLMEDGKITVAI